MGYAKDLLAFTGQLFATALGIEFVSIEIYQCSPVLYLQTVTVWWHKCTESQEEVKVFRLDLAGALARVSVPGTCLRNILKQIITSFADKRSQYFSNRMIALGYSIGP